MTAKRPRIVEPRVFPVEVEELIGVPIQRLMRMWQAGILPAPGDDGRVPLAPLLRAYIAHVERTAREEAAARATRETRERVTNSILFGL